MSLKNPVTPPGIDPGTVRTVAQRLRHYAIPGPTYIYICTLNVFKIAAVIIRTPHRKIKKLYFTTQRTVIVGTIQVWLTIIHHFRNLGHAKPCQAMPCHAMAHTFTRRILIANARSRYQSTPSEFCVQQSDSERLFS